MVDLAVDPLGATASLEDEVEPLEEATLVGRVLDELDPDDMILLVVTSVEVKVELTCVNADCVVDSVEVMEVDSELDSAVVLAKVDTTAVVAEVVIVEDSELVVDVASRVDVVVEVKVVVEVEVGVVVSTVDAVVEVVVPVVEVEVVEVTVVDETVELDVVVYCVSQVNLVQGPLNCPFVLHDDTYSSSILQLTVPVTPGAYVGVGYT